MYKSSIVISSSFISSLRRILVNILVFLMVFNGIPLGQISRQYVWEPCGVSWLVQRFQALLSMPDAIADDNGDCPGDLNQDEIVDNLDVVLFAQGFGRSDCVGDIDHDTDVDGSDLAQLARNMGCSSESSMPEGSFGGTYENLIPVDSTIETYALERFAVATGLVQDAAGSPIPGVTVSVLNHTEYGTATTDVNGRFFLPLQGGSKFTLRYTAAGFIEAQRDIQVPWNDFVVADTPVLIPRDTAATTITFDGNPDTALVHVGSTTSDSDGTREAVVVFSGDTEATAVNPDGTTTPLTGPLTIRATEFTTPESMPAILPPTSAFTYCVELTIEEAEGAARVEFSPIMISVLSPFHRLILAFFNMSAPSGSTVTLCLTKISSPSITIDSPFSTTSELTPLAAAGVIEFMKRISNNMNTKDEILDIFPPNIINYYCIKIYFNLFAALMGSYPV